MTSRSFQRARAKQGDVRGRDAEQAVLAPAMSATARRCAGRAPEVAVGRVVLAHGAPLALGNTAPALPVALSPAIFVEPCCSASVAMQQDQTRESSEEAQDGILSPYESSEGQAKRPATEGSLRAKAVNPAWISKLSLGAPQHCDRSRFLDTR